MSFLVFSEGRKIPEEVFFKTLSFKPVSLFESLRTYDGKIFRVKEHLKRLQESARTCGWKKIPDEKRLEKELEANLKAYGRVRKSQKSEDAFIRLTLTGEGFFSIIGRRHHASALYRKGIALKTSPVIRSLSNASFPEAKTGAYQNAVLASLQPKLEETYEWVFLDREGFVTEVRVGNLFVIRQGELLTPRLVGILNGVTRRFVIECALFAGIPVKERPITRHEIYNGEEAFLTNTSWEILPVRELDARRIGANPPGSVTRKLQNIFRQKVQEELKK